MEDPISFTVSITLDEDGDGTVPTEDDIAATLAMTLGETYPIAKVEVGECSS